MVIMSLGLTIVLRKSAHKPPYLWMIVVMSRLEALRRTSTKSEFAALLGITPKFLTHTLYARSVDTQYYQFKIPKKSGGDRIINAPGPELKDIQSRLSLLLLDCYDEIDAARCTPSTLSHGFARKKSIISNAKNHLHKKNVLNIDLDSFFDSFNFGRVRGFFIKNKNFNLHHDIATVIAKIACLNNSLPQGSPCSPIITNLITHILDILLAALAKKNGCTYTRYADDITFSTRKNFFPPELVLNVDHQYRVGARLELEINRSGFNVNASKTRVQYQYSRQDVTGLVVNNKVSIKSEYWRTTRAMCHSVFKSGEFSINKNNSLVLGNINELEGRLNFIDSIDKYNRKNINSPNDIKYATKNHGINYRANLNVREKTLSKFLYYKHFYANAAPTILCEGKTDNIYLKSAIYMLANQFPLLAKSKSQTDAYKLLVNFFNYTERTNFLLDLFGGGAYLLKFVQRFNENFDFYKAPKPANPVILLLDNDSGPKALINYICNKKSIFPGCPDTEELFRLKEFVHLSHNLYVVLTPLLNRSETCIEDMFSDADKAILVSGRKFDPKKDADTNETYSKYTFATKVVRERRDKIEFSGFIEILKRLTNVIQHYQIEINKPII